LKVTKYYTNLYNNGVGNAGLYKNMSNCVYFLKNLYYDANFKATIFNSHKILPEL
jgi:hypothetical protein